MNDNDILIPLNADPINLFKEWFEIAEKNELNDPNAMALSTISSDNKPSSRIVLLKSFSVNGFVFYTNSNSKKGQSISYNNYVALNFHWKTIKKQIRVEGAISLISQEESDKYFNSRPFESKVGALSSLQSEELNKREELIAKFEELKKFYENSKVPRPAHWNGYIVKPDLIEFWNNMPSRLHDRVEYKSTSSEWVSRRLYP